MESRPVFKRFWIKVLPDGTALPQFDPFTGEEHLWDEYRGLLAQVLFVPMTPGLAQKIRQHGNLSGPSKLPQIAIDIPPGSGMHYERRARVRLDLTKICGFCEAEFDPDTNECPRCLAKNQWYCSTCDDIKPDPILDLKNDQIRCRECEPKEPHGLNLVHCIGEFYAARHFFTTILTIDGSRRLIINW